MYTHFCTVVDTEKTSPTATYTQNWHKTLRQHTVAFEPVLRSMKFWYGSGSADPHLTYGSGSWRVPDFAIFVSDLQDVNKVFLLIILLFEGTFTSFFEDKKSQNNRNHCFSDYFCVMIEGSGSRAASGSLTNGSGSGRPKNIWILRIRIRIQIRNTGLNTSV
jgi:hypothetical protein